MKNKFGNIKIEKKINGETIKFDSIAESNRAIYLNELEKEGKIKSLEFQKKFTIQEFEAKKIISTIKLNKTIKETIKKDKITYKADFYYYDCGIQKYVIEDLKSEITAKAKDYVIKRKIIINNLLDDNIIFREVVGELKTDYYKNRIIKLVADDEVGGSHYKLGEFEVFDLIYSTGYASSFSKGNVIKYLLRFPQKNGLQDLLKAKFYLEKLEENRKKQYMPNRLKTKTNTILLNLIEQLKIKSNQKQLIFNIIKNTINLNYKKAIEELEILITSYKL